MNGATRDMFFGYIFSCLDPFFLLAALAQVAFEVICVVERPNLTHPDLTLAPLISALFLTLIYCL